MHPDNPYLASLGAQGASLATWQHNDRDWNARGEQRIADELGGIQRGIVFAAARLGVAKTPLEHPELGSRNSNRPTIPLSIIAR